MWMCTGRITFTESETRIDMAEGRYGAMMIAIAGAFPPAAALWANVLAEAADLVWKRAATSGVPNPR